MVTRSLKFPPSLQGPSCTTSMSNVTVEPEVTAGSWFVISFPFTNTAPETVSRSTSISHFLYILICKITSPHFLQANREKMLLHFFCHMEQAAITASRKRRSVISPKIFNCTSSTHIKVAHMLCRDLKSQGLWVLGGNSVVQTHHLCWCTRLCPAAGSRSHSAAPRTLPGCPVGLAGPQSQF